MTMTTSDTILIVDDNADDFFAASRMLIRQGLANPLVHLESAELTLEYLRGTGPYSGKEPARPCLILMDINMPGMKGIEALREIRKDASLEDIPVIMLTSSDADRDVLASFQGRANSYLGKPLTMKTLLDAVERIRNFRPEIKRVPGHSD